MKRLKCKKGCVDFNDIKTLETDHNIYIIFKSNREISDFIIKYFLRVVYGDLIPNITITNDMIIIEKDGYTTVKEV